MAKLQTVNGTAGKETIYVDVDDEITAIIDKVGAAKGKIVALVLPKRCPVLQSVVNMKLLKRTADKAGKNLVLVTSEAGLMPLAGATGLYVASSPTSKPAVPDMPGPADDGPEDLDEPLKVVDGNAPETDGGFDPKAAGGKSVGELAGGSAAAKAAADDDAIDLDGESDKPVAAAAATKSPKPKKDKKLRVPNFDSFRKKLMLIVLALIILGVAGYFALSVLPAATITIGTDSSTIPTNLNLTLDTNANQLDTTNDVVPATAQTQQKTATQTVPATGQQNNGTKATGSITMTLCDASFIPPNNVPVGSSVSQGGLTYVTQEATDFTQSGPPNGHCQPYKSVSSTDVVALKAGANYNVSGASFSVGGRSEISASGSASGGTDDIITVVQQSDIDNATNKINSGDADSVKQQLVSNLESKGLQPVTATFLAGTPQVTTNAKVGDQTGSVTVTSVTNYTMLGVKKSDLRTLVLNNVNGQLDKGKQVVLDDGVADAQFAENTAGTATGATVSMSVKSQAGPQLNAGDLKKQLAGMKSGDVKSFVKQTPGVTDVSVKFSPFWVNTVPKKAAKVTIHIEKAAS